jgi:hypothetical protein
MSQIKTGVSLACAFVIAFGLTISRFKNIFIEFLDVLNVRPATTGKGSRKRAYRKFLKFASQLK